MKGVSVGYFEVRHSESYSYETQGPIDVYGNEQFHLGRNPALCRRHWPDPAISKIHLRIHCVLYEEKPIAEIPPFVYATDMSTNGTFLKKKNSECANSQSDRGFLMGRKNGCFLLDEADELRISDSVKLIYHEFEPARSHRLTLVQERERKHFASSYLLTGRLLGIGGFGKVLVAVHQKSQRQLACKVINLRPLYGGALAPEPRAPLTRQSQESITTGPQKCWPTKVSRCFREFDILKDIDHPNIVSIVKAFWSTNTIYLFEELVTGGDLFSYIEYKNGCLTDVEAAVVVRQVLKGIEYLHDRNIVHRDLKPDNVLMTSLDDGARIVITDFGNARYLPKDRGASPAQSPSKKRMFSVVGTLEYAAPEIHQANTAIPYDQGYSTAVDMWSIGCITAALLAGDVIFTDRNDSRYEQNPRAVIMGLASTCDLSVIDDTEDVVWSKVGHRPKDFIKNLLVLREEDRMTATEALAHSWFSNQCHAQEFMTLYERSIKDWQPRRRGSHLVESICEHSLDETNSDQMDRISNHFPPPMKRSQPFVRNISNPEDWNPSTPLPPMVEELEEDEFESPGHHDRQSYDNVSNADWVHSSFQLRRADSIDSSMNQLSIDPEPPASGMYSSYDNVQVNSCMSGKVVAAVDETHEQDHSSELVYEHHTPETDSASLGHLQPLTMAARDSGPIESDSSIVYETPPKAAMKRSYSPVQDLPNHSDMFGKERTRELGGKYPRLESGKSSRFNKGPY